MSVEVSFNPRITGVKCKAGIEKAQVALDVQVLKDSNYYCPDREGTLMRSGVVSTGGGEIKWETPYARKQYHEFENKSKDKNPNASTKWFERARAVKSKIWEAIVNREYSK